MKKAIDRIVIALGGNAILDVRGDATAGSQLEVVNNTCNYIAEIIYRNYEIAIVHGNGPQVGQLLLASETAKAVVPQLPLDVIGVMSQGYIGYHIQQALRAALQNYVRNIPVVTLITQVVVDKDDEAFLNPEKPIGPFYTEKDAKALIRDKGYIMKEDAGRGWRRVVASPIPRKIVEIDTVKRLCGSTIVITCGGGGVPVIEKSDGTYEGIAAVIDKDYAAELLAEQIDAGILLILTDVEKVSLNYNRPDQRDLSELTVTQAEKYIRDGHFAPGSMLPKVEAAIKFARSKPGRKAIITSIYKAVDAIEEKTGTAIML